MRHLRKSFTAKRKQERVSDTSDTSEGLCSEQLTIYLKSLPAYERSLLSKED